MSEPRERETEERSWLEGYLDHPENMQGYCRARVVVAITEAVNGHMELVGISRAEMARRLGKSRSHVTQVLSGRRNMTLHTLADALRVCGVELDDIVTSRLPGVARKEGE